MQPLVSRRTSAAEIRRRAERQTGQCTWCGRMVPKGSRTWCSRACVDEFRALHDPGFLRTEVYRRDHGICAACGQDVVAFAQSFRARACLLPCGDHGDDFHLFRCVRSEWRGADFRSITRRRGLNRSAICTCLPCTMRRQAADLSSWHADHIVPLHKGGANDIANLRTLCCACHKRVTAEQARARARLRSLSDGGARE